MRRDGIPYVSSGVYNPPFPVVPLQDMTLEEIKKKYLRMCAKCNGDPSVCSKCPTPCAEGKRAIQLLSNQVYDDPPIPLYGGKTLIERAKEENMQRRKLLEEQKQENKPKRHRNHKDPEGWYEESLKAEDQLNFVMKMFNMTKAQARKKIYSYRYRNGLTDKNYKTQNRGKITEHVIKETIETLAEDIAVQNNLEENVIEHKIDTLMKEQEKAKQEMDKRYQAYLEAKNIYEGFSKKIDVLCSAMDIMNE